MQYACVVMLAVTDAEEEGGGNGGNQPTSLLEDGEVQAALMFAGITTDAFKTSNKGSIVDKIKGKSGISALLKAACTKHGVRCCLLALVLARAKIVLCPCR